MYRSPFKILQNKTDFVWNLQPLRRNVQRLFFSCNPLFVLLTLQIICQVQAEHDTTFVKFKYFHNSVDWSELNLQVYIPSWLVEILRLAVFRLLENALWNFHALGMIWSLISLLEQLPNKFSQNGFPPSTMKSFRKISLNILWAETLCPCSTGKSCRALCSLNICKEVGLKLVNIKSGKKDWMAE